MSVGRDRREIPDEVGAFDIDLGEVETSGLVAGPRGLAADVDDRPVTRVVGQEHRHVVGDAFAEVDLGRRDRIVDRRTGSRVSTLRCRRVRPPVHQGSRTHSTLRSPPPPRRSGASARRAAASLSCRTRPWQPFNQPVRAPTCRPFHVTSRRNTTEIALRTKITTNTTTRIGNSAAATGWMVPARRPSTQICTAVNG